MAANNCTIELVHGGTVHVEADHDMLHAQWADARVGGFLLRVKRMTGDPGGRKARSFPDVDLNPDHIVGIFPLSSTSMPQTEDYLLAAPTAERPPMYVDATDHAIDAANQLREIARSGHGDAEQKLVPRATLLRIADILSPPVPV